MQIIANEMRMKYSYCMSAFRREDGYDITLDFDTLLLTRSENHSQRQ